MFQPVPKPVKRVRDKKAVEKARKKNCEFCGATGLRLEVHHIEGQGRHGPGDIEENLITLCLFCHGMAQRFELSQDCLIELVADRMRVPVAEVSKKLKGVG